MSLLVKGFLFFLSKADTLRTDLYGFGKYITCSAVQHTEDYKNDCCSDQNCPNDLFVFHSLTAARIMLNVSVFSSVYQSDSSGISKPSGHLIICT